MPTTSVSLKSFTLLHILLTALPTLLVDNPSTVSETSSTINSLPAQSTSSGFTFGTILDVTTCQSLSISWNITVGIKVLEGNETVSLSLLSVAGQNASLDLLLSYSQPIIDETFVWSIVTVPPGNYVIQAKENQNHNVLISPPFSVLPGSNTTCILDPNDTPANSTTQTPPAPPDSKIHRGPGVGVLIGVIVGGVLLLILLGLASWYSLRKRRQQTTAIPPKRPSRPRDERKRVRISTVVRKSIVNNSGQIMAEHKSSPVHQLRQLYAASKPLTREVVSFIHPLDLQSESGHSWMGLDTSSRSGTPSSRCSSYRSSSPLGSTHEGGVDDQLSWKTSTHYSLGEPPLRYATSNP